MTNITLTVDTVNPVLDALLKEFGEDYVYPGSKDKACYYVANGQPSCLVGQVLYRLGVPIETLEEYDEVGSVFELSNSEYSLDGKTALERGGVSVGDDRVLNILDSAQGWQDQGKTWGEAVRQARKGY